MHPLKDIKNMIDGANDDKILHPQYRLYSAHDRQIANIMKILKPDLKLDFIPYSSTIYFELYLSKDYKDGELQDSSYKVRFMWDDEHIDFPVDCSDDGLCDGQQWLRYLETKLWVDQEPFLRTACKAEKELDPYTI